MNAIEQLKSVLCDHTGKCSIIGSDEDRAIVDRALQALAAPVQPVQEPVAVKHMMGWVESLKRQSDYGQHMHIPGLSAGACFELAIELEQFIKTTPPAAQPAQKPWVDLTVEQKARIHNECADSISLAIELTLAEVRKTAAQPAVPDAITDNSESPEYRTGWNDCRQAMMEMMK